MINTNILSVCISISETEIVQKFYNTPTELHVHLILLCEYVFLICVRSTALCLSSTTVCYCSTMRVPGGSSLCSPLLTPARPAK